MRTIEKIVELTGGWDQLRARPIRIEVPPMMPLTVEFAGRGPASGMLIAVAHAYEQNGDIMMDPEILVEVSPDSSDWLPVSFQQDSLAVHKAAVTNDAGKIIMVDHRLVEDLKAFMRFWNANLREHGFIGAARRQASWAPPKHDE